MYPKRLLFFLLFYSSLLFSASQSIRSVELARGWTLITPPKTLTLDELKTQLGQDNFLEIDGAGQTYQKRYVDNNLLFLNDFTALEEGESYWVKLNTLATLQYEPEPVVTASSKYHDVLGLSLKFYEAQRAIGPFPTVDWRKPASTNDGADVGVDLNGGWFDAGDHVKFNLPMSYSVGMINWSMIATPEAYAQSSKTAYGKDQVKYALDYLLNTYNAGSDLNSPADDKVYFQVADGNVDHGYWGPPENLNTVRKTFVCDANGGCAAVAGSMVGAFASGAVLFKDSNPSYAQELLDSAKRLHQFATKYPTDLDYPQGQNFYPLYQNTHNEDQLAWGAYWLYRATGEQSYLDEAKSIMTNIYPWSGHSWDNMALGVFTLLAQETNSADYKTKVEKELDKWVNKSIPTSTGGLRVLQQWGSLRYASTASFIALMYSDVLANGSKKTSYINFAKSQMDYILGDNPNNFSYVVGYGTNYPLQPHHRAASGTSLNDPAPNKYVIEGALVGGPKTANDSDYTDSRESYIDNEVATDYNAGFTGALAKLASIYAQETNSTDNNNSTNNGGEDNNGQTPTDSELLATAKALLTFESIKNTNLSETEIKSDLSLITLGEGGVSIRWHSSSDAITPQGVICRGSNDVAVTLTATLTQGEVSDTKTFTLLVLKEEVQTGACQVDYHVRDNWATGFVVDVSISNQIGNLYGWELTFTLPTGQRITDMWNGNKSASEGFIKVLNKSYNAQVNKGNNIEFGFVVNHSGQEGVPSDIRLNGKLCDGQTGGITAPEKPSNLEATLINNSSVHLTWQDNSDNEDNFLLFRSVDLGVWELLASVDVNTTTYNNLPVEIGHSYEYKVQAKNIAGLSTSNIATVTPLVITLQSGVDNRAIALVSNCASCHREEQTDTSIPLINGLSRDYLDKTLKGYRDETHFSFVMHRIADGYSDDELDLMTEHFSKQPWVGNAIVSYDVDAIGLGETLFKSNCINCHGTDGKKNKIMLSGQSEQYLIDTMTNYARGLHRDAHVGMKAMFQETIGDNAVKIEALAKYLATGLSVPQGDNFTIRGFNASYLPDSNEIALSWDYIHPNTERLEVRVNGVVVKTVTQIDGNTLRIDSDGSDSFVLGQNYSVLIRTIVGSTQRASNEIVVEAITLEAYGRGHYNSNCKVCHGVNGTSRADLTAWDSSAETFAQFVQNSSMPADYYSNCDQECLDAIGIYIEGVLIPRANDNNTSSSAEDVASDIPRGYRLLNTVEYTNTLYSLFEIDREAERSELLSLKYTDLPKDNIVEGYNTDRDMTRMDENKIRALTVMATRIETYLGELKGKNDNRCLINNYDFCVADSDEFLDTFATKIFRRPLSVAEKNRYLALDDVAKIVGDMLVSPKFLYRSEMGELSSQNGIYQLTPYEIATAISYSMAGTTPDDTLLSLAENGALLNPNTRVTEAVRLSKLQTGKDKLDDFIGRWLLEDNVYSLADKNPIRFAGYTQEVRDAQSEQILKFFRMVMEDRDNSTYKDLFLNEYRMSNAVLANFYGDGSSSSETFEKVPATEKRYGILTLGAIASKYANSEEAHPFKRGKFVLARLMCHPIGLPGNGGDVPSIQDHKGENKRDRYANHVNDPSCATCHNLMDPIGYSWENYDGSGRYRTHEFHEAEYGGPKVIDSTVTLKGLLTFDESETHPAQSIRDVSEVIAQSDRGPECMALQYYRYISGDTHAELENSLVVKKIASDFKDEQYDLQSLFTNMVKLNAFITRKGE